MVATEHKGERIEYSSFDMSPDEFEDISVAILERFLGEEAAKDSVASIREDTVMVREWLVL